MGQQRQATLGFEDQVLAPAAHGRHAVSHQLLDRGIEAAQGVDAGHPRVGDPLSGDRPVQQAGGDLYLGQLGHLHTIVGARRGRPAAGDLGAAA